MKTPTPEQQAVLDNPARVRVISASPGTGKTTLVGMLIRKQLEDWSGTGGITALSFTRVGGEEIRRELGYDLSHPHFVGTIDAFLFRYIVRPFLRKTRPGWAAPRLIPADWSPKHWGKAPGGTSWTHRSDGGSQAKIYNLFEVCFIDEDATGPVLAYPRPFQGGIELVTGNDRIGLFNAKRRSWQSLGWLTHTDAALLASEILHDATFGPAIRSLLLRRFPSLIVDELQDTGFFLAKSIRLLLAEPSARGILVGDPNQAIYEFNGARPGLFNGFAAIAGAARLPLGSSQRCLAPVVGAALHMKESADPFDPAPRLGGRALLVRCINIVSDLPRLIEAIRARNPLANSKVVARQSKTVEELTCRVAKDAGSLYCPALTHVCRAVKAFRQGHNLRSLANTRAALELAVFGHEGVSDEQLEEHKIDPSHWKALAVHCLIKCNDLATTGNLHDWQTAAGKLLDEGIVAFGLPASLPFNAGELKPQKRTGWNTPSCDCFPSGAIVAPLLAGVPVQTVHAVKGETHDVTVFVCPNPSQIARCPSTVWWSNDPEHLEERRIAYVAMTRTRGDLVLCVSEACYMRLHQNRQAFVMSFQCLTVDEFTLAF